MNRITLQAAGIGSGVGAEVPPISGQADAASVTVFAVETDERPLLLSLLLTGRIKPDTGSVELALHRRAGNDRASSGSTLRDATALVDTPVIAEPPAGVRVSTAVAEELAFAARPSTKRAVLAELARHGLEHHANTRMRALPAADRLRLLLTITAQRPDVKWLVLTSPERHGASTDDWWPTASALAADGLGVIVVTDAATATALIALGAADGYAPTIDLSDSPTSTTPESIAS